MQILKIVLTATLIISVILIFPIFINIELFFSKNLKRLFFAFRLFGFISIIGGYIESVKEGFALHITEKKAFILSYSTLLNMRKKVKPLKDYHFKTIYSLSEIGYKDNSVAAVSVGFMINYIGFFVCRTLENEKPYLSIRNDINIYEGEDIFNYYFSGTVIVNILTVLLSIIKIIAGKVYYAIRKGIQQNKQSN